MSTELPDIETQHSAEDDSSPSGTTTRSTKSYDAFEESVVGYTLAMLQQNSMDAEIALTDDNARELTDDEKEYLGVDRATHLSVESLFGLTTERDYVGSPPGAQEECDDCDSDPCERHDIVTDRHITIDVAKRLNGNHLDAIWDAFDDEGSIRVGMGKASRHDRDELERRQWVRIWYSATEKQARSAKKSQLDAGTITEEEYVTWCVDNEVHPQPRKEDTPELAEYADNPELV